MYLYLVIKWNVKGSPLLALLWTNFICCFFFFIIIMLLLLLLFAPLDRIRNKQSERKNSILNCVWCWEKPIQANQSKMFLWPLSHLVISVSIQLTSVQTQHALIVQCAHNCAMPSVWLGKNTYLQIYDSLTELWNTHKTHLDNRNKNKRQKR